MQDVERLCEHRRKVIVPRARRDPSVSGSRDSQSGLGVYGRPEPCGIARRTESASSSLSRLSATARFSAWDRRSLAWAVNPVGRCVRMTAVSTLLRFWPPGPDGGDIRISHCSARTRGSSEAG